MSPEVSAAAAYLQKYGLYDIEPDDGKLSTGYTTYLPLYDEPFIFNCPYGAYTDYTDMFHEFGHYLAFLDNGSDWLYGVSDYDLSELQSQGMVIPGANKAAVAKGLLLDDAIDCGNPATFVKLHPDVTVVIDQEVADAIGYRA